MPDIERCWLCHKICERPWNPPDISPEDMCQCSEQEQLSVEERISEAISEIIQETRRGAN